MADMTRVSMSVRGAEVVTVPIDDTLTIAGQAADAKATGDALAMKADKSELQAAVKVNNQPADAQGLILIDGRHIPVSDQDTETLANAVTDLKGKTAADIPMSSDSGAKTIAEVVNANSEAIEGMEEMTGATMPIESGSQTTVKAAIEARVKTVNRKAPDADGDVDLSVVPLAENLQSDKMESVEGSFIIRTTGGNASVSDGKAYPLHLFGAAEHTGYVAEELNMTVIPITRTEPDEPITATIDRDTFVAYVEESGTINLYYTTEWSADPELYGITVTGTPVAGDQITVVYVKEVRGTITVANPARLVGTGWNLFDYNNGYARVVKYSTEYGYKIGGSYASIQFSATLTGERSSITPGVDGLFNVPSDGYVFVTGGNNTDTYILTTWSDWMEGPSSGYWEPYRESGIDLSAVMTTYFPNGLLAVGTTSDEIDLSAKRTISRVERIAYTAENLAAAIASGREFTYDTNYIYLVRAEYVISAITIDTVYNVSEHGLEWFTETDMPLITEILYGKNLRDKLERDVLTISQQTLAEEEKAQVRRNIGVMDPPLNGYGTAAQLLKTNGDGTTEWTTQGTPTDAQVGTAVSAWLTAHPEATTTVQDGAISRAKLNDDLKAKTDAVPELMSEIKNFTKVESGTKEFEQGVLRSTDGGKEDSTTRIRLKNYIPPIGLMTEVLLPQNLKAAILRYSTNSVAGYVDSLGWKTGNIELPATYYYKICIAYLDNSTILPSEGENVTFVTYSTDETLEKRGIPADAYTTGAMFEKTPLYKSILAEGSDLNEISIPGIYVLSGDNYTNGPSRLTSRSLLCAFGSASNAFEIITDTEQAPSVRFKKDSNFTEWKKMPFLNNTLANRFVLTSEDDLNSITETSVSMYFTNSVPENAPFSNHAGIVTTIKTNQKNSIDVNYGLQYVCDAFGNFWYRVNTSTGFSEWVNLNNQNGKGFLTFSVTKGVWTFDGTILSTGVKGICCSSIFEMKPGSELNFYLDEGWEYTIREGNQGNRLDLTAHLSNNISHIVRNKYVAITFAKKVDGAYVNLAANDFKNNVVIRTSGSATGGSSVDEIHDLPENQGQLNVAYRAYQLSKIVSEAKAILPCMPSNVPSGNEIIGVPYSSVRETMDYIPQAVSLDAFRTMMENPNSYIYTKSYSSSAPGYNYNAKTYFGAVCSSLVAYCYGIDDVIPTTIAFENYPGMNQLPEWQQDPEHLKLGDMLNNAGSHIVIITDIIRTNRGVLKKIEITEAQPPECISRVFTPNEMRAVYFDQGYTAYRYEYISSVPYTPSPWINLDETETAEPSYNKTISPRKGEKSNWKKGETVEIDVLDNTAEYTDYVLYNVDTESIIGTYSLPVGNVISVENLDEGRYSVYLSKSGATSDDVKFDVIAAAVEFTAMGDHQVKAEFETEDNEEPSAIYWCNNKYTSSDYKAVRAFHILTDEEKENGYAVVDEPDTRSTDSNNGKWLMRMCFKTEFGLFASDLTEVNVT